MRLQVFLSHSGRCSRRKALDLVKQGCVMVNNQMVCEPSYEVNPEKDNVYLQGIKIEVKSQQYVMLNKPQGFITTKSDSHAEKTVMDLLPKEIKHLNPVGRLDKDSEGLLLLTNNGELAFRLTHPSFNVDKTYLAEVKGRLKEEDKHRLMKGIFLQGAKTSPCKIKNVLAKPDKSQFEIIIHEGKKRQIRLMLASLGYQVLYLKRIALAPLSLENLPVGKWRFLKDAEISALKNSVGLN